MSGKQLKQPKQHGQPERWKTFKKIVSGRKKPRNGGYATLADGQGIFSFTNPMFEEQPPNHGTGLGNATPNIPKISLGPAHKATATETKTSNTPSKFSVDNANKLNHYKRWQILRSLLSNTGRNEDARQEFGRIYGTQSPENKQKIIKKI